MKIRRRYLVQKQTVTDIAKDMGISRPTVRKHITTVEEPQYQRKQTNAPKLGQFKKTFAKPIKSKKPRLLPLDS